MLIDMLIDMLLGVSPGDVTVTSTPGRWPGARRGCGAGRIVIPEHPTDSIGLIDGQLSGRMLVVSRIVPRIRIWYMSRTRHLDSKGALRHSHQMETGHYSEQRQIWCDQPCG